MLPNFPYLTFNITQYSFQVNTTATFKFIISSVPFTSFWTVDPGDGWSGYLEERDALLILMGTIPNVFVISGDKHEFAAIQFLGCKWWNTVQARQCE
jgi:alkaline phosphatase D